MAKTARYAGEETIASARSGKNFSRAGRIAFVAPDSRGMVRIVD